jgi:hypothetical protein
MNGTSLTRGLAAAAALFGLATGLALQHQTRLELRQEWQALQQQLDRVTDMLAESKQRENLPANAGPAQFVDSELSTELPRLRVELEILRQLTNEWPSARNDNREAHSALDRYVAEGAPKVATADFWPRDSWSLAGFGTPDDALRSSLWASDNGNLKALLDSTTGEFRQMIEKEFEGKSADEAAIRAMDEVSNLKSVQVINRDFQGDDTVVLTAEFDDGERPHTTKLILKKVGNEWKLAGMSEN